MISPIRSRPPKTWYARVCRRQCGAAAWLVSASLLAADIAFGQGTGDYGRSSEGTKSQTHHQGQPQEHRFGEAHPSGGTTTNSPFKLKAEENRAAWTEWCEEYKRLLKEVVWQPLDLEFSGKGRPWYQAQVQFLFQNPASTRGPVASFGKPGIQVQDRKTLTTFSTRLKQLLNQFVKQAPAVPEHSQIAYFTRNATFTLNYGTARQKFGDCENFLDEIEGRAPQR